MAHWPAYMYRQELIELMQFGDYEVEVWATRRGTSGDVFSVRMNNIVRDIPHAITEDEQAVEFAAEWLTDKQSIRKEFYID